jgi:hypothetical protein
MAGAKGIPNWQDKAVRKLEGLQYNEDFKADIAAIPRNSAEATGAILDIIKRYELSHQCGPILYHYAVTGEMEADRALSGMSVICDDDETAGPADSLKEAEYNYIVKRKFGQPGINIFIPAGVSITEVKSFITSSWPYIETKLVAIAGSQKVQRTRRRPKAERDTRVRQLHNEGYKNAKVAEIVNEEFGGHLIDNDISKILEKREF